LRVGRQLLYAGAISGIGLGVRSVVGQPLPMSVVAIASATFTAIVLAGVLEPRLGMFADVVVRGERNRVTPRVALTFDDGPSLETTPRVLDLLDEAGAKATFFVVGRKLEGERKNIARDAVARGHAVACHSYAHDRLFALRSETYVRQDLAKALLTIEDAVGVPTKLFRPPIGHTNPTIARVAEELGLTIVGFSVRGYDGLASARPAKVARRIVSGLRDGAIALLHDGAERDDFTPAAPEALPRILEVMAARELVSVTVPQLLAWTEPEEEQESDQPSA
jgi:peptidoglycan/xylan/chitin deacetylase (PgdA/CDA1 family)